MTKYISDVIDMTRVRARSFNLIVSPCGSGKTYFCANTLTGYYGDVLPGEILFVTSRSLAANQLVKDCDVGERFNLSDYMLKRAWMGKDDLSYLSDKGLQITTYDKVIRLLLDEGYNALRNVKIIIFDECHTIFSDRFIDGMDFLAHWIYSAVREESHIIFGLTATPGIVYDNAAKWCTSINKVCDLTGTCGYRAKNLWIVDFTSFPEFYYKHLTDGKTIIMCDSIKRTANVLYNSIHGSKMLVSKSGGSDSRTYYNPADMDYIRHAIVNRGVLPGDVKVLIATSTVREGFNLVEESGVRNVVTCFTDEMHIAQILGRCRYDVDNLVVLKRDGYGDVNSSIPYFEAQHKIFEDYTSGKNNEWFKGVSHLVSCTEEEIGRFDSDKVSLRKVKKKYPARRKDVPTIATKEAKREMSKFIKEKYVVKPGMSERQINNRIIDGDRKQAIVDKAIEVGLFGEETASMSCTRILNICAKEIGFEVDRSNRRRIGGKQERYTILKETSGESRTE